MSKPVRFTQSDLTRALKACEKAGLGDVRVEVEPGGKIVIMSGQLAKQGERNPWDEQ